MISTSSSSFGDSLATFSSSPSTAAVTVDPLAFSKIANNTRSTPRSISSSRFFFHSYSCRARSTSDEDDASTLP
eukprot:13865936-Ditylum_brightwellii.AAC.1